MGQRICSIEDCTNAAHSRGWCNTHYDRWRRTGVTGGPVRSRQRGRVCSIEGCTRAHEAHGYCSIHYARWRNGQPIIRACPTCGRDMFGSSMSIWCSAECRPSCSEPECDQPVKTRGLCVGHYDDLLSLERTGKPRSYRWAKDKRCLICGATDWDGKGRKVCSPRCQQLLVRNGGQPPPTLTECARCGSVIDLTERGKAGRKKRADTKMCHWCKERRHMRHKVSVMDVVNQRGIEPCAICSDPVDLALRHPDLFRASIDHIIPYSRGGTHDLDNLQVVHLYCNFLKSDREGFTI